MTKQGTLWIIWEAENQTVAGVHEYKKDAEAQMERILRTPGHEADLLSVHEVPSRHH